ncbi:MAG: hypothetical protein DMG17_33775 [Acidobacteria bacterium]|nr:MAG: hypothetical protein DMG17_33775 [Acidobacteriota bacterium]
MAKTGPDMQRVPEFNVGDLASPKAAMSVAISVVLRADEIPADSPDLIVFPEGISWDQIHFAAARHPHAAIVGGVDEGGRIRAALWHAGANRIDYRKIGTDGRTKGSGLLPQAWPVYEFDDRCVGVLLCMDIDFAVFSRAVVERIQSSQHPWKFLCVPANMGSYWFEGSNIGAHLAGMHVIVCNHTNFHQVRCASFVTNTTGSKIHIQENHEPIHVKLPAPV